MRSCCCAPLICVERGVRPTHPRQVEQQSHRCAHHIRRIPHFDPPHHCRGRCTGRGFYRPDLSYLPAIEQHINELRADRETALAMGAAEFITTALTAQIIAYQRVIDRMHKHLGSLPASERTDRRSQHCAAKSTSR
ncbi:hypothetical protein [Streptomyces sp. PBSH9]|uniref:hypothetical protein n=1 Tax=Streptomyces sp. PBSH9 TaxID=2921353 RepID=UPI001FABF6AF|nr:hypothetical protein [Streptomyces sp. PBSH9]